MYSLTITPKIKASFKNREDWEKYKVDEANYCLKEYREYCAAFSKKKRKEKRNRLDKKRMEFYRKAFQPNPSKNYSIS